MNAKEIYQDLELSGKILVDQMTQLSGEDAPELVLKVAPEAIGGLAIYLRDAEKLRTAAAAIRLPIRATSAWRAAGAPLAPVYLPGLMLPQQPVK